MRPIQESGEETLAGAHYIVTGPLILAGINMHFTIHDAPPQLADSVKAIWCARGTKQEFDSPDPIVPDGCVEIVFNLGDRFIDPDTGALQPRDLLAGQMTRPVVALPTGEVDLIGVRFKTGRAGAALRTPMHELKNRLIAGSDVLTGLDRLVDELANCGRAERLDRLGSALAVCLDDIDTDALQSVDQALSIIATNHGAIAIEALATRVGVTRRHLERQFREFVGLRVKHVARISRIHSALDMLQQQPLMSGAEIAAACGYSDQAHMIRECRELTGQTPRRLKSTERSLAGLMREAV